MKFLYNQKTAAIIFTLLLFTGCSLHKRQIIKPPADIPESFMEERNKAVLASDIGRWWERFGDKKLENLMEEAFLKNLDLIQTFERLKQLQATERITGAARYPTLDAKGSGGRQRQKAFNNSIIDDSFDLSLAAGYEVDLWRKLQTRTEAARLEAIASKEDIKALYISISARLSDLYYLAVEQRAQLELSDEIIESFQDTLERVERRYREGLVPALDVYQSRQNLAEAKAGRTRFEVGLANALHDISILLGRYPDREIGGSSVDLIDPPDFATGIPSQLLTRRPDIQAALLRLKASDERIAAAIADRFPVFNLVAGYGGANNKIRDILDSPNIHWNLLMEVAQPVFDAGKRKAEVDRTKAVFRENLAVYHQSVLNAFKEVEDALASSRATKKRIAMLEERVSAASSALRLSLLRYTFGLSDYLPVLAAQQSYADSKSAFLEAKRQLISDRIQLARALGGEWGEEIMKQRLAVKEKEKKK
jgi:NodT family efflux transporter outer membrane factor (OMF) lipoprotein